MIFSLKNKKPLLCQMHYLSTALSFTGNHFPNTHQCHFVEIRLILETQNCEGIVCFMKKMHKQINIVAFFFPPKRKYEICPQIEDMHMQVKDKKLHLYKCTYKRDH